MSIPFVIIVSGPPCTGKTTVARFLARELRLPLFSKDGIKELLYDTLGWGEREWSRKLGVATMRVLFSLMETELAAGRSFIIESNFKPELANEQMRDLQGRYGFEAFQVQCVTRGNVLLARFKERAASGERHPGHVDHLSLADVEADLLQGRYEPLDVGGTVFVLDTTDLSLVDYQLLLSEVRAAMAINPA